MTQKGKTATKQAKANQIEGIKKAWPKRRLKRLLKDNPSQYGKLGFHDLLKDSMELLNLQESKVVSV